nr:hypothetical protein BACY1_33730 [Tenacibaculum mesophilum]
MFETIFLQASSQESLMNMLPFVAMIAVFYFLIIRPQMRRQKKKNYFKQKLKKELK